MRRFFTLVQMLGHQLTLGVCLGSRQAREMTNEWFVVFESGCR